MRLTSAPICPIHYVLDPTADDCEYNYPGGVACPGCLQFNFTLMECDNYLAAEGENYDAAGSSYQITPFSNACFPSSSNSSVLDTAYGHNGSAHKLDYNPPCRAGQLALEFFDEGGSTVPQTIVDPPGSGINKDNPAAVWAVQRGWQWNCCLFRYTANAHSNRDGTAGKPHIHWTISPAPTGFTMPMTGGSGGYGGPAGLSVYEGCVDGLVEDSGNKSAVYGTSYHPFDAGTINRPLRNHPVYASSQTDAADFFVSGIAFSSSTHQLPTGPFGALQWWIEATITGSARASGGCYSPLATDCPDPSWGTPTPCLAPSQAVACSAGYTYNPSTDVCELYLPFVSFDRGPALGTLLIAEADPSDHPGALRILRYDDANPEALAETIVVQSDNCSDCCVSARRSGEWILTYIQLVGSTYTAFVSRSIDQGRSWQAPMTIATGYQQISHYLDDRGGILAVMVYSSTAHTWSLIVGTLGSDGVTWSFTSPTVIVTGAAFSGQIRRRKDGVWEFVYVTTVGAVNIVRCKSLSKTGAGTFA